MSNEAMKMAFAKQLEQIEWLHGAAEEAAAVNLKMTMKPEEILHITSMILALLAERDADKEEIEKLRVSNRILASDAMCKQERIAELEAAAKQNAQDVQIKERLCRESNSLHDRLRVAEKRVAEYQELISDLAGISSSILREVERINNSSVARKGEAS